MLVEQIEFASDAYCGKRDSSQSIIDDSCGEVERTNNLVRLRVKTDICWSKQPTRNAAHRIL